MKGLRKKVTSIVLAATLSFGMLSGTGLNVYADETSTEEVVAAEQQTEETATEETADDTVVVVTEEAVEETAVESVEASDEAEASEKSTEDTEAAIASDEEIEAVSEEVAEEATEETVEESEDASEVIEEAEESEEAVSPAFSDEAIIDGVTIKVSAPEGVFPEGAYLSVSSVSESEKTFAEDAVSAKRAADTNVADSYTFDIKVLDSDGNELQPEDGNLVKVSFSMDEVSNENLDAIIYHIPDDGIADQLYTNVEGDTASAMSDGFSLYTVEFSYGTLEYVINGGGSVALSEILSALGLSGEVTSAVSSSPELFTVTNESGELMVNSLQAFDTNKSLTVTIDGVDFIIYVKGVPAEEYNIWIGSTQITSANCSDVLGDGTVSYNNSAKALTFNNFVYDYDTMGYHHYDNNDNAITIGVDGVNIHGRATITADKYKNISGIFTSGNHNLYLQADSLIISVGVAAIFTGRLYIFWGTYDLTSYNNYAINAKAVNMAEDQSIKTIVNATGATHGVFLNDGTLNVAGGTLNCKNTWNVSEPNYGPYYAAIQSKTLIVTGGSVEALGENGCKAIKAETINIGSDMGYTLNEESHKKIEVIPYIEYNLKVGKTKVTSYNKDNILNELDAEGNPTATFDPTTSTLTFTVSNPAINMTGVYYAIEAKNMDLTINAPNGVTLENPYNSAAVVLWSDNTLTLNGDFTIVDAESCITEREITSDGSIVINGNTDAGRIYSTHGDITITGDTTIASITCGLYAGEGKVSVDGDLVINSFSEGIYAKDSVSITGDVIIQNKKYDGIFSEGSIVLDGKVNILTQDENGCGIKSVDGNITITGDTDIEAGYNGIFVKDESETGDKAIILSGENNKVVSNNWTAVSSGAFIIITGNITATGNNCAIAGYCGVDITGNVEASSKNFEAIYSYEGSIVIDGNVTASTESNNNGAIYAKKGIEVKSGTWTLDGSSASGAINAGDGYKIVIPDTHEIREPAGGKLSSGGNNILNEDSTRAAHVVITRKKGVITFDVNGGLLDGAPTFTVEAEVGDTITIPTSVPVRDGYTFTYWKGSEYYPGDTYIVTGDHTLTAQWEVDSTKGSSSGSGTSGGSGSTDVNTNVGTNNGTQNVTTTDNTPVNLTTKDDSSNSGTNNTVTTTDNSKKDTTATDVSTKKDTASTDVNTKKDSSVSTSGSSSDAKAPAATVTTGESTPNGTKNLTTNQKSGPATGDNTSMFLLLSLMAISLLGMITIVRSKKSKA